MKFDTSVKIVGNVIYGSIKNEKFIFSGMQFDEHTLPPFKKAYELSNKQLDDLILELQKVRTKLAPIKEEEFK